MKVKRSVVLRSPVSEAWRVMTDLNDCSWRSDITRVESFEQGKKFIEYSQGGVATRFAVTEFSPVNRYAFTMENENFVGEWVGELSDREGGTLAVFVENIRPKRKLLYVPAFFYIRSQQKRYIRDLKRALGENE